MWPSPSRTRPAISSRLEERFTKRPLFAGNVAALDEYRFVFGKGAVPVVEEGRLVGAVGVSAAIPAENDHTIADSAAGHPTLAKVR